MSENKKAGVGIKMNKFQLQDALKTDFLLIY